MSGEVARYNLNIDVPDNYLLGCLLSYPETADRIFERIQLEYFDKNDITYWIFYACKTLYSENKELGIDVVRRRFQELQKVDPRNFNENRWNVRLSLYLVTLFDLVPSAAQLNYYLPKMVVVGMGRMAQSEIVDYLKNNSDDPETAFAKVSDATLRLAPIGGADEIRPLSKVASRAFDNLEKRMENPDLSLYTPTGFSNIDRIIHGFTAGDYVILAARPSMGKSALALNILSDYDRRGLRSLMVMLEMTEIQTWNRWLSIRTGIPTNKIRDGNLNAKELSEVVAETSIAQNSNLTWFFDSTTMDFARLRAKLTQFVKVQPLDLIVIDYLQLLEQKGYHGNRQQEISDISRNLKRLAKELNVRLLVLSQLSRACEQRTDKRPQLSDLRESGSIEQDADLAMFLYRDSYYTKDKSDNKTECIIRKNRNGGIGDALLYFFGENQRFRDAAENF